MRIALACLFLLAGCVAYTPYGPSTFDMSWSAASGALRDQGAQITREDRTAGVIDARIGDRTVNTRVFMHANGAVQVEFNTSDTGLANQISRSYETRMGR